MTLQLSRHPIFVIFLLFAFVWNQNTLNSFDRQILIQAHYEEKIKDALSILMDEDLFSVSVTVDLLNLNKSSKMHSGGVASGNPVSDWLAPSKKHSGHSGEALNDIKKIDVNVVLDAQIATGSIKTKVESIVKTMVPHIEATSCKDCISITFEESINSNGNRKLSFADLQNMLAQEQQLNDGLMLEIAELEDTLFNARNDQLKNKYKALEEKYKALEERYDTLETQKENRLQQDLKFYKDFYDTTFTKLQEAKIERENLLTTILDSRLDADTSEQKLVSEALETFEDVMQKKRDDKQTQESLLGMQIQKGSGRTNAIIFLILIVTIVVLVIMMINKKPKTIYLKPKVNKKDKKEKEASSKKDKKAKKNKTDDDAQINDEKSEKESQSVEKEKNNTQEPEERPDEDAIRSELRSLRQTAVSLTVGEKESASSLIKEWLSDNPNEQSDEEEKEE